MFQRGFNFRLPKSAVIINHRFSFSFTEEEYFYLKVSFSSNDYEDLKKKLNGYFKTNLYEGKSKNEMITDFKSGCYWWNLNEDEIVNAYYCFADGKRAKTRYVYAFITETADGKYYLYAVN